MLKFLMSLCSVLELLLTLLYYFAADFSEPMVRWCYLLCLLVEPAGYYVFAGYVAMRGVSTTAELVNMMLVLPMYYFSILVMAILRVDMHESVFLSNMIYYDFSQVILLDQLVRRICMVSVPLFLLTFLNLKADQTDWLGFLVMSAIGTAVVLYALTAHRIARRHLTGRGHTSHFNQASVSESESDATYLDYAPLLQFDNRRVSRV